MARGYKPDPTLSAGERLIVIETLLVSALDEQDALAMVVKEQAVTIGRLQRAGWALFGFAVASGGGSLLTVLSAV